MGRFAAGPAVNQLLNGIVISQIYFSREYLTRHSRYINRSYSQRAHKRVLREQSQLDAGGVRTRRGGRSREDKKRAETNERPVHHCSAARLPGGLANLHCRFPASLITCAHESLRAHESFIALIIERQGRALNDPSIQIWRARRAFCKRIVLMYARQPSSHHNSAIVSPSLNSHSFPVSITLRSDS